MTQEDKDLLLKDLCARLPYAVKAQVYNHWRDEIQDETIMIENLHQLIETFSIEDIKPYLFPLSSMTEEQKRELRQMDAFISTFGDICFAVYDEYGHDVMPTYEDAIRITNWLNKNNFDYRGLIPKDLAIDATGLNIY